MRDISRMGAAGFTALGVILPLAPSFPRTPALRGLDSGILGPYTLEM